MAENLTILLFAPHSAIWVHAFPEALIAESLEQGNHRIVYVTCSGEFHNYCVCMSAYGLDQNSPQIKKKNQSVRFAINTRKLLKKILSLMVTILETLLKK